MSDRLRGAELPAGLNHSSLFVSSPGALMVDLTLNPTTACLKQIS